MIYLASQSPRRRQLLEQIGIEFTVFAVDVDESVLPGEMPDDYVVRMAKLKAEAATELVPEAWPVLAADTIVVCDDTILLKPVDKSDGVAMLNRLSGRTHQVKTAIAVAANDQLLASIVTTDVSFRTLEAEEIDAYWHSGEPLDKAGAYGIQGLAGKFVSKLSGSYFAVVGLPLLETEQLLQQISRSA